MLKPWTGNQGSNPSAVWSSLHVLLHFMCSLSRCLAVSEILKTMSRKGGGICWKSVVEWVLIQRDPRQMDVLHAFGMLPVLGLSAVGWDQSLLSRFCNRWVIIQHCVIFLCVRWNKLQNSEVEIHFWEKLNVSLYHMWVAPLKYSFVEYKISFRKREC